MPSSSQRGWFATTNEDRNSIGRHARKLRSSSDGRLYIFSGGGSGGHLYPGIAVARELLICEPASDVLFVGSDRPVEHRILSAEQFDHVSLPTASTADLTRNPLLFLKRNWTACRAARRLIAARNPAAVVGLGGFASVPVVMAAQRAGVPTILLEQNVSPGRATRWLASSATRVCLSFPETERQLSRSAVCVVTGNPVRREIATMPAPDSRNPDTAILLVLGGSQGARGLNRIVLEVLPSLANELQGWTVLHQTGETDEQPARELYARTTLNVHVRPFIENLCNVYQDARLVVSRAGATTLSELACCGLPSVLIPFPGAARDHQTGNAAWYAERGAALMISESANPGEAARLLSNALTTLLRDESLRRRMSDRGRAAAPLNAAANVVRQLLSLANQAAA